MMQWMVDAMWAFFDAASSVMEFVGALGLLILVFAGLARLTGWFLDREEARS